MLSLLFAAKFYEGKEDLYALIGASLFVLIVLVVFFAIRISIYKKKVAKAASEDETVLDSAEDEVAEQTEVAEVAETAIEGESEIQPIVAAIEDVKAAPVIEQEEVVEQSAPIADAAINLSVINDKLTAAINDDAIPVAAPVAAQSSDNTTFAGLARINAELIAYRDSLKGSEADSAVLNDFEQDLSIYAFLLSDADNNAKLNESRAIIDGLRQRDVMDIAVAAKSEDITAPNTSSIVAAESNIDIEESSAVVEDSVAAPAFDSATLVVQPATEPKAQLVDSKPEQVAAPTVVQPSQQAQQSAVSAIPAVDPVVLATSLACQKELLSIRKSHVNLLRSEIKLTDSIIKLKEINSSLYELQSALNPFEPANQDILMYINDVRIEALQKADNIHFDSILKKQAESAATEPVRYANPARPRPAQPMPMPNRRPPHSMPQRPMPYGARRPAYAPPARPVQSNDGSDNT